MKKVVACTLLLCCLLGGACAQQRFEGRERYWDVLPVLLTEPEFLTENPIGGGLTVIELAEDATHYSECRNQEIIGDIAHACGDLGVPDDKQCVLVKFRSNNDSGLIFEFSARDYETITLDLTAPDFPAVGFSAQPEKYLHIGDGFVFVPGEWYFALFAVDTDAELLLVLWQDGVPDNMAHYHTQLGSEFKNRAWGLFMDMHAEDAVDIDIAGLRLIRFTDFGDGW